MSTTDELRAIFGDIADLVLPHLQGKLVPFARGNKAGTAPKRFDRSSEMRC